MAKKATFHFSKLTAMALIASPLTAAWATNGMLMEGYGPISTAMGGASQAYNHGTAALAQNPATLALDGAEDRLDIAIGLLGPDVKSSMAGMPDAASGGNSYVMPAFGFTRRSGALTYGIGMFAQGGMGTEYASNSFLAAGSNDGVRSELGVGSVILPLAYQVNPDLTVGATFDYMWSSLDLQMAASGAQLAGLYTGGSGNINSALPSLGAAPWARISFTDSSKFSGAAKATGFGAKVGFTQKLNRDFTVGGSYQFKSALDDMTTERLGASMSAPGFSDGGRMTVINFQMPSVIAVGLSWQASPATQVVADIKSIGWAEVMKSLRMRFDSAGMGGSVSFALPQNWKDQTVINLGVAYKTSEKLTLRAGVNLADNPIPTELTNPLFPAIVKEHYTAGFGYKVTAQCDFNASLTLAPSVSVTNASGVKSTHGQTNLQLMYTQRF